jgi:hypothetical protein
VSEVHNAQDSEDERQTDRHQRVKQAGDEAVDRKVNG